MSKGKYINHHWEFDKCANCGISRQIVFNRITLYYDKFGKPIRPSDNEPYCLLKKSEHGLKDIDTVHDDISVINDEIEKLNKKMIYIKKRITMLINKREPLIEKANKLVEEESKKWENL